MRGVKTVTRLKEKKSIFQAYQTEIYRIGWRVQYRAKKIRNHELPYQDTNTISSKAGLQPYLPLGLQSNLQCDFTTQVDNKILVNDLIRSLPPKGRLILHKLYIQDQTEAEVSKELNLSQQAVNKWKRKMLQQLSQTVNS
jgi:RNA polymerase sigma factor (sigma-70 family)